MSQQKLNKLQLVHSCKLSKYDFGIFRSPGPGLGNLLFPIARALIGQHKFGGAFIYPTMRQIKFGTYFRGEADKRTYGDLFQPRTSEEFLTWIESKKLPKLSERSFDGSQIVGNVIYEGLGSYFHELDGYQDLIRSWILRHANIQGAIDEQYDIGIHIRQGDFLPTGDVSKGGNIRLPIRWYEDAFLEAKRIIGNETPSVCLFTDGDPLEIARDLSIPELRVDSSGNAITAILNLSKAKVVITSRSTFSMWSVFLGDMPAIWDKNLKLNDTFLVRSGLDHQM